MRFLWTMINAEGILARLDISKLARVTPRFNISPSQQVPIYFFMEGLTEARWGMPVRWHNEGGSKLMYNARSEGIMDRSLFKTHFEEQRCLMLADGFYEWRKPDKTPFVLRLKTKESFAFAGVYAEKEEVRSCCMITCPSNDIVKPIHDRMPVIVETGREKEYLEATPQEARALLKPIPGALMEAFEVSRKINGARTDSPDLIEPAKKKTLFDY